MAAPVVSSPPVASRNPFADSYGDQGFAAADSEEIPVPAERRAEVVATLRTLDTYCQFLAFQIGIVGTLSIVAAGVAMTFGAEFAQAAALAFLLSGGGLACVTMGCAVHFRQLWAVWIVVGLTVVYLSVGSVASIVGAFSAGGLSLLGLIAVAIGGGIPLALCGGILSNAATLREAGVPLSAESRHGRVYR